MSKPGIKVTVDGLGRFNQIKPLTNFLFSLLFVILALTTVLPVVFVFIISISFTACVIITRGIENGADVKILAIICVGLLIMVNAGYGGGFSNVPTLLSDHFGMKQISAVHGMCLSAWAIAGLTGNNMSELILNLTNKSYDYILIATTILYFVALIICIVIGSVLLIIVAILIVVIIIFNNKNKDLLEKVNKVSFAENDQRGDEDLLLSIDEK